MRRAVGDPYKEEIVQGYLAADFPAPQPRSIVSIRLGLIRRLQYALLVFETPNEKRRAAQLQADLEAALARYRES